MSSERLFQILSYAAVFCGFFALWISGIFGITGTFLFLAAFIGGWFLEGSRWQASERVGTVLIVLALPVYYYLWRSGFLASPAAPSELPGILSRLIVTLSAVKILQRKSDRDWIFLYLMSFFEVLLGAGLSISAVYFATLLSYVFVMVSTIILFEIRKTRRTVENTVTVKLAEPASTLRRARRVPAAAIVLIIFIAGIAAPMFFLLPRVGGAGLGAGTGGGTETASGFSDTVKLGGIGRIQQSDGVVMRVRLDDISPASLDDIRWRGVALDTFDNQSWRKSRTGYEPLRKGPGDLIQLDAARSRDRLVLQTVYLDPINSPVIFVLPRAVGVQAPVPFVNRDAGRSYSIPAKGERISYRVISDTSLPDATALRRDNGLYLEEHENYLQVPDDLDPRISGLTSQVIRGTRNRYDAARAVEEYLQTQFGYTLDQKAGGQQPLADFLFNVREGHCEYFSTAMAVMLRTQGIATRVVNGFQRGEYNETADVFVVRQRNAHSWVEVYFPGEDAWVTFDPTPFAGQNLTPASGGIISRFNGYLEALETFWIQYFVAYDSAEQRSLFSSVRRGVASYGKQTSSLIDSARESLLDWWRVARGDEGFQRSVTAVGWGLAYAAGGGVLLILFVWLCRRIVRSSVWNRMLDRLFRRQKPTIIEFYDRLLSVLASKGFVRQPHQTPLELAYAAGMPQAVKITEKYNRVRFGEKYLSVSETDELDHWLRELESGEPTS